MSSGKLCRIPATLLLQLINMTEAVVRRVRGPATIIGLCGDSKRGTVIREDGRPDSVVLSRKPIILRSAVAVTA